MTANRSSTHRSPLAYARRLCRQAWRDVLSVYYANTPVWRVLKSGGLLVFGFFCWSASSLVLSYRPEWTFLNYAMAYGFVLILWGPLTHAVILPLVIRLRRSADRPITRAVARNGSKLNLSVFLAIVLVLGTYPAGPMTLDFQPTLGGDASADVDPELECVRADGVVRCELSDPSGIDHVVVTSAGEEIHTAAESPFSFEVRTDDLAEVVGQKQFTVELRDEDGDRLRQYTRNANAIPERET